MPAKLPLAPEDFVHTGYAIADQVLTITLNRPERRNALNWRAYDELAAAFHAADADPQVRCVIVTGADPAFCSGDDVGEIMAAPGGGIAARGAAIIHNPPTPAAIAALDCRKPVIAAVNGAAIGWGMGDVFYALLFWICGGLFAGIVLIAAIGWVYYRQSLDAAALIGLGLIVAGVLVVNLFSKAIAH